MIEFRSVQKMYKDKKMVIKGATFEIERGEFVFLVGPSGAGKSTLLNMLIKRIKPMSGDIIINNKNIKRLRKKKLRRNIGYIFQEPKLLENKTVRGNVAYALEAIGKNFKIKQKSIEALERLGLEKHLHKKKPEEISGGERRRVSMARAVINQPDILICDEPTANLDNANKELVMKYLFEMNEAGTTIIMATHDREIVTQSNKRVLYIEDGRVITDKDIPFLNISDFIKKNKNEDQLKNDK